MTGAGYCKLIEHEGEKLSAYQDSLGYWTIGVGHLIDARLGGTISQRISRELLDDDLAKATAQCRVYLDFFDGLDPVRQDVFIMLMFNMGPERISSGMKRLFSWQIRSGVGKSAQNENAKCAMRLQTAVG